MAKLTAQVRERRDLEAHDIAAMYRLFEGYYDGACAAQFERDLSSKTHIIELRNGDELCGFSTLAVFDLDDTEPLRVIFSGDTIIQRAYWGEQALAWAFCRFAGATKRHTAGRRLYWLLISKGHRTYRYLHLFARSYHPHPSASAPAEVVRRMHRIARERFGSNYDEAAGIVRFGTAGTRLQSQWHDLRAGHRQLPDVAFFHQRNPGHESGDELVCLCELEASNLRSFALRAFREGLAGSDDDDVEKRAP